MIQRCTNPRATYYRHYGGRGIGVCERWLSIEAFIEDMGERPLGTSLDRIDNDRAYEPSNCRWATPKVQANNRRNNRHLTSNGKTMTLSQWSDLIGLSKQAIRGRIALGWNISDALKPGLRQADQRGASNNASKLTAAMAAAIKRSKASGRDLAAKYNVSPATISMVRRGERWKS